jgi:hypothetical protein
MTIITMDNKVDSAKVQIKPFVSAIHPPINGAMIVAGAVRV